MSTVPVPTLGPTGYVEPSESDILTAVLNDINTAFGGGLNITLPEALTTPQGQIATSLAAYISDEYDLFLNFVNQVDPQYAEGIMQDAIGLLYFQTRFPATSTNGPCTCTGLPGTVIPTNAQAKDTSNNVYLCADGGTIPSSGSITLTFANQVTGPIPCQAGALNQIYLAIPGWSGITNPADLIEGTVVENAQDFELRRQASVASNAQGNLQSIRAAVISSGAALDPPNVPSNVYVTENFTGAPVEVGGVVLAAHSLYVAVLGGDPDSIAQAIWSKKSVGCDYNGNTTIVVEDTALLTPPYPTYNVTFEIPSPITTYFLVVIRNNPQLPANIAALVKSVILDQFTTPNNTFGGIGTNVYAGSFYGPVTACAPGVQVFSIAVGTSASPGGNEVQTNIDQYPHVPLDGSTIQVVLA